MESDPASHSQLPRPISSFIGREAELTTLHQMLSSGVRLITLVGPGGVGKTRLALEVCARAVESYPDGVVFVTLESIADVDSILPEIARGSSIDLNGNVSPLDDLIAALKKRHLLLCVDNWEHLIEASGQMAPLLAACPGLQMIATSREPLRLRGEHVVWVEPLQLPSPGSAAELETVTGAQAVQLFVERARAVRPGFDLGPNNAAAVLEICSLVDGLPLAIELAAALIRSFSPETLLARMKRSIGFTGRSGSFETLVGGPRDLPIRQQTLHETINWSYSLLDTDERRVFRRLAVFAGGCDLEAAKAVCQPNNTEATTLLNTLIALADKNLLLVSEDGGEARYRMLRMIQEYALEKLTLEAESQETYKRHATYFHKLAKCTVLESGKLDPTRETERLDEEYDNYRAALSWFITNTQVTESHELTANLWRYWYWRGIATEGLHWLEQTLNLQGQVAPEVRSATLYNASVLALQTDNYSAAKRYAVECVSLKSDCGDLAEASAALRQLAVVEFLQNDLDKALLHLQESVALSEEAGCEQEIAESLLKKGWILFFLRNYSEAKEHVLKALDVFSNSATAVQLSDCWHLLGDITAAESRLDEALGYLRKAKSIMPDSMNYYDTIELDLSIGKVSLEQRQLETANHIFKKCLTSASDMRDRFILIAALEALACLAVLWQEPVAAAQLWGSCDTARIAQTVPRFAHDQAFCDRYIGIAKVQLGVEDFQTAHRLGISLALDQAVQLALDLTPMSESKPPLRRARRTYPAGLTPREVEVLRLVAQGLSDHEVAEKLVLSPRTINAHLTSIYSKLDVNSRVAATRFAMEHGLAS